MKEQRGNTTRPPWFSGLHQSITLSPAPVSTDSIFSISTLGLFKVATASVFKVSTAGGGVIRGALLQLNARTDLAERWCSMMALPSSAAVSGCHHGNALSRAILSLWRGPGTHNSDIIGKGKMLQNIAVDMHEQHRPVGAAYDGAT